MKVEFLYVWKYTDGTYDTGSYTKTKNFLHAKKYVRKSSWNWKKNLIAVTPKFEGQVVPIILLESPLDAEAPKEVLLDYFKENIEKLLQE